MFIKNYICLACNHKNIFIYIYIWKVMLIIIVKIVPNLQVTCSHGG